MTAAPRTVSRAAASSSSRRSTSPSSSTIPVNTQTPSRTGRAVSRTIPIQRRDVDQMQPGGPLDAAASTAGCQRPGWPCPSSAGARYPTISSIRLHARPGTRRRASGPPSAAARPHAALVQQPEHRIDVVPWNILGGQDPGRRGTVTYSGSRGRPPVAVQHHPDRLVVGVIRLPKIRVRPAWRWRTVSSGIVGKDSADSDEHGVHLSTQPMHVRAGSSPVIQRLLPSARSGAPVRASPRTSR